MGFICMNGFCLCVLFSVYEEDPHALLEKHIPSNLAYKLYMFINWYLLNPYMLGMSEYIKLTLSY